MEPSFGEEDSPKTLAVSEGTPPNEAQDRESEGLIGKRIGNYIISKTLGRGGMGVVFVAEHPSIGRRVAVKFLARSYAASSEMSARFSEEARTAASLQHPNVVDILDFGELDGRPYYVMELLEGEDLAAVIKREKRFSVSEITRYLEPVAAALDAAHARGIVHRDLKPANIFVLSGSPPRVKLMDFGIAKLLDRAKKKLTTRTLDGQILGTPTHMAPEQAMGAVSEICCQTDLYALGVILYEMIAGVQPFRHESAVVLMAMHARDPFVPIEQHRVDCDLEVAAIVERCLAKSPADRPESVREVMGVFRRAKHAQPLVRSVPKSDASRLSNVAAQTESPASIAQTVVVPEIVLRPSVPFASFPAAAAAVPAHLATPVIVEGRSDSADEERRIVDALLAKMQRNGDFPAFVKNITQVTRDADLSGSASAGKLGDTILKDYGLTAKLLRLVNSSYYERFGRKTSSLARAVVVLGFERVRSIALSVAIHRNPGRKMHAAELAELSINALVSGEVARVLASKLQLRDREEAMVCAMFRNLGRHVVVFYLPEEYDRIRKNVDESGMSLEDAEFAVLGISTRRLGWRISQAWGLSPRLSASMGDASRDKAAKADEDKLRLLSSFANEFCGVIATTDAAHVDAKVRALMESYEKALPLAPHEIPPILASVEESFKERYEVLLGLDIGRSGFFRNARKVLTEGDTSSAPNSRSGVMEVGTRESRSDRLERGLAAVEAMADGTTDPKKVLGVLLQVFATSFGFRHAVLLAPSSDRTALVTQAAFGECSKMLEDELAFLLTHVPENDVFVTAYRTAVDIVIADTFEERGTSRIPRRYYELFGSTSLAIYSCRVNGATKLLVADTDTATNLPKEDAKASIERTKRIIAQLALPPVVEGAPVAKISARRR